MTLVTSTGSTCALRRVGLLGRLSRFSLVVVRRPLTSSSVVSRTILRERLVAPIYLSRDVRSCRSTHGTVRLKDYGVVGVGVNQINKLARSGGVRSLYRRQNVPM